jgi:hypothetical protein
MDQEQSPPKALRPAVRALVVLASGVVILAIALAVVLFWVMKHASRVAGGDQSATQRVFREYEIAAARLHLPDGYTLVHVERGGSVGGLFKTRLPTSCACTALAIHRGHSLT